MLYLCGLMKEVTLSKRLVCILFGILWVALALADVQLTLTSGQTIAGEILLENDEVVLIKTSDGGRYQYLKKDVSLIDSISIQNESDISRLRTDKKVSVGVQVTGGISILPQQTIGGFVNADLKIGACNVLDKRIFLGGAIGYHGVLLNVNSIGFIPIQVCTEIPFLPGQHSPYIGIGMGYGFAVQKSYKGGVYGNAEIGWRYRFNAGIFSLSLYSEYQQGVFPISETIEDITYTKQATLCICNVGIKCGIAF